jgi:hypothetical protein
LLDDLTKKTKAKKNTAVVRLAVSPAKEEQQISSRMRQALSRA